MKWATQVIMTLSPLVGGRAHDLRRSHYRGGAKV
jgi:hypothetical protein